VDKQYCRKKTALTALRKGTEGENGNGGKKSNLLGKENDKRRELGHWVGGSCAGRVENAEKGIRVRDKKG